MLDVYAARIEGLQDADLEAISGHGGMPHAAGRTRSLVPNFSPGRPRVSPEFGSGMAVGPRRDGLRRGMRGEL